jgi:hypothetical protein
MQKLALFGWIAGLMVVCSPLPAQEFRFPVRHDHVVGSCAGELIYHAANKTFQAPGVRGCAAGYRVQISYSGKT